MSNERPLTNGERLVGLGFNPSGDEQVTKVKKAAAAFIDVLQETDELFDVHPQMHWMDKATTDIVSAQMFAVKALTWKDEA